MAKTQLLEIQQSWQTFTLSLVRGYWYICIVFFIQYFSFLWMWKSLQKSNWYSCSKFMSKIDPDKQIKVFSNCCFAKIRICNLDVLREHTAGHYKEIYNGQWRMTQPQSWRMPGKNKPTNPKSFSLPKVAGGEFPDFQLNNIKAKHK